MQPNRSIGRSNSTQSLPQSYLCKLHYQEEVIKFFATIILSIGAIFITVCSIVMSYLNKTIDPQLRGILIGYSVADFVGALALTLDTAMTVCAATYDRTNINIVVTISVFLSLFHIMFLLLAEYQITVSDMRWRSIYSFSGLIIVSWITSSCIGSTLIYARSRIHHICMSILFILVILLIVLALLSVAKASRKRINNQKMYERNYLDLCSFRSQIQKRYWKLKYFIIILFSYVACVTPWIVEQIVLEVTYLLQNEHDRFLDGSIVPMIYTMNFYFPSSIVIYLWHIKTKDKKLVKLLYEFTQRANRSYTIRNHFMKNGKDGEREKKHLMVMRAQHKNIGSMIHVESDF